MQAITLEAITSYTRKVYAPINAVVTIIRIADHVALVTYNAKSFPCPVNKLRIL